MPGEVAPTAGRSATGFPGPHRRTARNRRRGRLPGLRSFDLRDGRHSVDRPAGRFSSRRSWSRRRRPLAPGETAARFRLRWSGVGRKRSSFLLPSGTITRQNPPTADNRPRPTALGAQKSTYRTSALVPVNEPRRKRCSETAPRRRFSTPPEPFRSGREEDSFGSNSAVPSTIEHSRSTFNCGRTVTLPSRPEVAEPQNRKLEAVKRRRTEPHPNCSMPRMLPGNTGTAAEHEAKRAAVPYKTGSRSPGTGSRALQAAQLPVATRALPPLPQG
jgi:hypothetical protein